MKHDLDSIQILSNKKHSNNFIILTGQTYINNKSKLNFYCKTCNNIIEQRVDNHLHGAKCKICSYNSSFLKIYKIRDNIKKIFDDKYILPDQQINGTKNKVNIFCKKCNKFFDIRLNTLLSGYGCNNCRYDNLRLKLVDIRLRSNEIHFNKFYIPEQEIKNNKSKIAVHCNDCGNDLKITISNFLQGYSCKFCSLKKKTSTIDQIKKKSNKIHNDMYFIEEQEIINTISKIKIFCKKCNTFFTQTIRDHLQGCGCPNCNFSKGEKEIEILLKNKKIEYIAQKRFDNCKDKLTLPFDFYLPKINTCIEYDGEQHFKIKDFWGGESSFEIIQRHDKIKNDFCYNNNINLIRIKFNENINEKLNTL